MKTDLEIQEDVLEELKFDPSVNAENIGISVKDGVVALSGFVPSYREKYAAEKATFRVSGVKAVAEEIEVHLPNSDTRTDVEIAKAAANAIDWNAIVPKTVQVSVEDARVILRGQVKWGYQRIAATQAVRNLKGVKAVTNHITILSDIKPGNIKNSIERALVRSARTDAKNISIDVVGGEVTLRGTVHSRTESDDAKWAAWAAPGVTHVNNRLAIG